MHASKYHKASGLFSVSAAAKYDWTTDDAAAAWLQDQLELDGYGGAFQVHRDGEPLDEQAGRQAIVQAMVADLSMMGRYQEALRRMAGKGDNPRDLAATVEHGPEGLTFKHGDFRELIGGGLQISGPKKTRRREKKTEESAEESAEDRRVRLETKRQKIQDTPEKDYLDHANQCGYLLKNVTLNFLRSTRMRGTSVKTKIKDLVPDQLRGFTDADGEASLAALSTHEDTELEKSGRDPNIYSGWSGFARAVIDFLNIDMDVDSIAARHRESGGGPKYRPLNKWGVGRKAVVERLVSQRPDIDAEEIKKSFMKGYGGKLSIGGKPAIKVRF